jgi:hypothetical protein
MRRRRPRINPRAAWPAKCSQLASHFPSFAGLVVFAGSLNPIPFRTRPLNSPAPMVLSLKTWKSRSLPGLPRTEILSTRWRRRRGGLYDPGAQTNTKPPPQAAAFLRRRRGFCGFLRQPSARLGASALHRGGGRRVCGADGEAAQGGTDRCRTVLARSIFARRRQVVT